MPVRWSKRITLLLLSLFFIVAGSNHFLNPQGYVSIMPTYLPAHLELVYLSGLFEILGGLGILFCCLRTFAAIGLMLLTIAVFPANVHMALHSQDFADLLPAWVWYARLPLQLVILIWIYRCCLSKPGAKRLE